MDYGRWLGAEADGIYGWVETMLGKSGETLACRGSLQRRRRVSCR
jgi:hypothetical protein